jgi:hypothetical protein
LITSTEDTPRASAVRMFPAAAAANRPIFYDRAGQARSVSEVYTDLATRYTSAASSPATRTALALYGDVPAASASATAAAPAIDNAAYLSTFPDVRSPAPSATTVASAEPASSNSRPVDPMFRSLFQVDDRSQPVSSTVRELWGNSSSLTSAANATPSAPRPLDLFSDRDGSFSS